MTTDTKDTGLNRDVIKHLANNINVEDYSAAKNAIVDYNIGKPAFDSSKISSDVMKTVEKNMKIAEDTIKRRLQISTPMRGDFIKIDDNYYRIAMYVNKEEFQYCIDGSFYIQYDTISYSGSFEFGTIKVADITLTNELRKGGFWFFSNGNVKGYNGVHFYGNFKVWEFKKKEIIFKKKEIIEEKITLETEIALLLKEFDENKTADITVYVDEFLTLFNKYK